MKKCYKKYYKIKAIATDLDSSRVLEQIKLEFKKSVGSCSAISVMS